MRTFYTKGMRMEKMVSNISVDCVIFGFDSKQLNVLLVERKLLDEETGEPLVDDWTLAGYHILEDEDFDTAATRILKNLSGLDNIYLEQFYAFGKVDRINSEKDRIWRSHLHEHFSNRVATIGYYSLIDSSTTILTHNDRNIKWFPVNDLPELGFDHREILDKALSMLRIKFRSEPIGFELLPDRFTLSQLQSLYESVMGIKYDRRNFRKKVLQMKYVIPLDEKETDVKHKPAQLFLFSKDVYERTRKERFVLMI